MMLQRLFEFDVQTDFYNEFSNETISGNLTVGISDHLPQFALLPSHALSKTNLKPQIKKVRELKKINTNKFNKDLNDINWHALEGDANQFGNNLIHTYNQILDKHAPETNVKTTNKQAKKNAKPWITKNILSLIKNKNKFYHQFVKESDSIKK